MSLDLIAQYYDLLYGNLDEDWSMWQTLTEAANGPLLEVGCGTGRLLLPLAEAGHTLTGLDLSVVALEAARAKIKAAGLTRRVSLHRADMRDFDLPRKNFALAFIPLNTFMHCASTDEQLSTLVAIHHHLRRGGQLIIDIFHPDPALLAEADGRLYFEDEVIDDLTGHTVQWYWRHQIDLAQQIRHLTYVLDEIDSEGLVRRAQLSISLRFVYRYEMELLLRAAGFTVETIYGSYDLEPFHSHSQKMIFVARKEEVDSSR
ncbi:MAG: class I SAM-dependent methyltransferase [Anaerolineae bacterium]|nr:class I SAM-dependent methyltransferase [Anaerolineales bacterium]MCQ3973644.1 class I SAM-dependent methyltransferase [Anaerolineae bacterium]